MFTVLCRHAHFDRQSTEAFLYVIEKSNIFKHVNILLSLTLKEKQFQTCLLYIHIIQLPTNKGANYYKLKISKIGNYGSTILCASFECL